MKNDILAIKLKNPNVEKLEIKSEESALTRPYKKILAEGKDIGRINNIFYGYGMRPTFTLGTVSKTPGDRILFFPGLRGRKFNWYGNGKKINTVSEKVIVDHFSLENNMKWHVTMFDEKGEKIKIPRMAAKPISDNLNFWFSFSIKNENCLEKTPSEISIEAPCSKHDIERRSKLALAARSGAVLHIVHLPENSDSKNEIKFISGDEFLNFEFFLGPDDEDIELGKIVNPFGPPSLRKIIDSTIGINCRMCPVRLPGFSGIIWVRVSKLPGNLEGDCIITSLH